MNPTLKMVLHWGLNIILVLAGLGCILLALFGQSTDTTHADSNRFMTMMVGIVFLGLGAFFTVFTVKRG